MNNETLMLRQINPGFIQGDQVSSQAFRPTPKDKRRLSVYDGDQLAPQVAYKHYTNMLSLSSAGVMAVSVAECGKLELPVRLIQNNSRNTRPSISLSFLGAGWEKGQVAPSNGETARLALPGSVERGVIG